MSRHNDYNDYNDYVKTNNAGKYMNRIADESGSGLMDMVWFMVAVCLMLVIMQIE